MEFKKAFKETVAVGDIDFTNFTKMNNIMGLMAIAGMVIGGVLIVWGCVQMVLVFRNDDVDGKMRTALQVRAELLVILGILLLFISAINSAITGH